MAKPTTRELVEATGISRTYAHDVLAGNQAPSIPLAAAIWRVSGWKHPLVAEMSDAALDELERANPWSPKAKAA